MVKLMENTYRDINIAIANEFSRLADRFGVDVWEAISIANLHPRVQILTPGAGVGGHCIGVDPWFLVEAAPELTPLIYTARRVNDAQPGYVVTLVRRALHDQLAGRRIAALGLSYKPDVDDLRESPAIEVVHLLQSAGARVFAYEPYKTDYAFNGVVSTTSLQEAIQEADLLVLLVAHDQFKTLDPRQVAEMTKARVVLDAVNAWKAQEWQAAGFQVFRLGAGQTR
jgi:UDP-N-acetyl-D-mannosaminuronic acid dehydrogenase